MFYSLCLVFVRHALPRVADVVDIQEHIQRQDGLDETKRQCGVFLVLIGDMLAQGYAALFVEVGSVCDSMETADGFDVVFVFPEVVEGIYAVGFKPGGFLGVFWVFLLYLGRLFNFGHCLSIVGSEPGVFGVFLLYLGRLFNFGRNAPEVGFGFGVGYG